MRFLIENYASHDDTQAFYFYQALKSDNNHEAFLWQSGASSLYDILDKFKPDFFITHAYKLSKDLAHYINETDCRLKLLLSVRNLTQDMVCSIEDAVINSKIKCGFFFSNDGSIQTKKIRFVHINDAYDDNLTKQQKSIDYDIDTAYIVNTEKDITVENKETYHFLSTNSNLKNVVDIVLPEINLSSLYSNYKEIVFRGLDKYIPQSFFDAIMLGNKVYYERSSGSIDEIINKMLKTDKLKYDDSSRLEDFSDIRKHILDKHTSKNRAKTLLSQLPKE